MDITKIAAAYKSVIKQRVALEEYKGRPVHLIRKPYRMKSHIFERRIRILTSAESKTRELLLAGIKK